MTAPPDFTARLLVDAGLRPGMRVLDVGCGFGDVTLLAAALVGEAGAAVGVDLDGAALERARGRDVPAGSAVPTFAQAAIADLPATLDDFDAIVGRRVLMYQADAVEAVRVLAERLRPGGIIIFQEHDATLTPASLTAFPLHARAQGWLQRMIEREGADLHIGFHLHAILTRAGLGVEQVRAEAIVQTPTAPYALGAIVRACLPRIVAHGVASAEEVDVDTLQARLDAERTATDAIYVGDVMFGAWARKPAVSG
ncbi:methyltransferase domain-containing protein [Chenggangzhangella methanolivorans]|uniref:methyltransferase domain-containing protein n=1 Tax=Chenggangzhangella methanolivorans TaxID=1437009 RepID=UPI00360684EF